MGTHTKGLLYKFPTVTACLCGEAGVHSDDLMPSTLSLGREDIEELTPTRIMDTFREMVVLHHVGDLKVFDGNALIAFSVVFGGFEIMVSALPFDLQMCLSGQIVFHEEFARLLIVLFGGGQHLIVEMPRRDQAPHEGFGLGFLRIEAIFKRSHGRHFAANELSCQEGMGPSQPASEAPTLFSSP